MPIPNSFTVATCTLGRTYYSFGHKNKLIILLLFLIIKKTIMYTNCEFILISGQYGNMGCQVSKERIHN